LGSFIDVLVTMYCFVAETYPCRIFVEPSTHDLFTTVGQPWFLFVGLISQASWLHGLLPNLQPVHICGTGQLVMD